MSTFFRRHFIRIALPVTGAALGVCLVPSVAHAQDADFSKQGHLTISSDANLGLVGTSTSDGGGSSLAITVRPAIDYFVADHLSLGGFVSYAHDSTSPGGSATSTTTDAFGIGPRIGYDIPLSDSVSLWPKAYITMSYANASVAGTSSSDMIWGVGGYVPLMIHPVQHFFLGLGPYVQTAFADSQGAPKTTEYGLQFTVGGWVGP